MNAQPSTDDLDLLICKLLDQTITPKEHNQLSKWLETSRSNRLRYLEIVRCESLLHWEPGEVDLPEELPVDSPKLIPFPVFTWVGSVAACLLALAGGWWAFIAEQVPDSLWASQTLLSPEHSSSHALPSVHKDTLNPGKDLRSSSSGESKIVSVRQEQGDTQLREGIEILRSGNRFASGGTFEFLGDLQRWNRVPYLSRGAENGVLPATGANMIGLEKMNIDVESQIAQSSETVQVVDVRKVLRLNPGEKASVSASVKFNQSFGETQEGAEFGLTLQAYGPQEVGEGEKPLLRVEKNLFGDRDPNSWHQLTSELELPNGAEYVVVSLSAKKLGPDALLANTSSYYCDDLEFSLTLGDHSIVGPI